MNDSDDCSDLIGKASNEEIGSHVSCDRLRHARVCSYIFEQNMTVLTEGIREDFQLLKD